LVSYKNTWNYKNKLDDLLEVKYSLVEDWYRINITSWNKEKIINFEKIIKWIAKSWEYILWLKEWYFELIKELVDKDIWFYDTKKSKITANSKSFEIAFKKILKELNKK
jgi:hypothetical protein